MFKKFLIKALILALLTSLVVSKSSNDCEELKKYVNNLKNDSYSSLIRECKTNSEGKLIEL